MPCKDKPAVTVAMGTCYRREHTGLLERAVGSILNQTFSEFEFLICEYDSTEQARSVLERFAREDNRVRILHAPPPGTLAHNLNQCLREARGAWFARMDDDDWSDPERLSRQVAYLSAHQEIAFVGCWVKLMQDGGPAGLRKLPEQPVVRDFFFTQPYIHPALVFRRSALEAVAGYSEEARCLGCEDYDLLLRLYEHGYQGANLKTPYLSYTLPPSGTKKRTFSLRVNEAKTRFIRFQALHLLPGAWPFVVKPLAVGLLPASLVEALKKSRGDGSK